MVYTGKSVRIWTSGRSLPLPPPHPKPNLTLNIPDMESVKLDVWESSRNSATLIMKAKKQPNITMAMVTQRVELS